MGAKGKRERAEAPRTLGEQARARAARTMEGRGQRVTRGRPALEREGFQPERGRRFYPSIARYLLNNPRVNGHAA
jgi:hypothetical protein